LASMVSLNLSWHYCGLTRLSFDAGMSIEAYWVQNLAIQT
jgi:hypothetical protein